MRLLNKNKSMNLTQVQKCEKLTSKIALKWIKQTDANGAETRKLWLVILLTLLEYTYTAKKLSKITSLE